MNILDLVKELISSKKLNVGELIGLNKAKIIHYPYTGMSGMDIRGVFKQSQEDDNDLIEYYNPYWNSGKNIGHFT